MRRLVLLLPLALLAFGSAGATGNASSPGAEATAWAIQITPANSPAVTTPSVTAPPDAPPSATGAFSYPADGSILSAQSTTADAATTVATNAGARAESDVSGLSLFGGELTADAVTARASAGTGYSGAGGNQNGSGVTNLVFEGQPVTGSHLALGDWGSLTVGAQGLDRTAPAGAQGYRGFVTELDIQVTTEHDGLPPGSEIEIGYAEAAAQTAPTAGTTTTGETTTTEPEPIPDDGAGANTQSDRPTGVTQAQKPVKGAPLKLHPPLTAGPYVFPVYGPSSYVDTFGAGRSDVSGGYHHGDDIFGQLGQPLVAVASGTVFSVGWNKVGGNRLWLLDTQGNQFYYAHLSAFSTAATDGAHVKAGEVVGFMGNTGDAKGTPYHLHFEIHPVSTLYLGYDGAVDPSRYLEAWSHQTLLPFPVGPGWAPAVTGNANAPEPGAILLGMHDISTANGLDPSSLTRALTPLKASALMQTLVPVSTVPVTSVPSADPASKAKP